MKNLIQQASNWNQAVMSREDLTEAERKEEELTKTCSLERLYTSEEAAALLNISINWLHLLCNKGIGPKRIKLGNRSKFRRSDLEKWIETNFPAAEGGKYLTTKEVADLLNVNPQFLYKLCRTGKGPERINNNRRYYKFKREDVEKWLIANEK